jgi:putative transposase
MARPARLENANHFAQHLTWTTRDRKPLLVESPVNECCLVAFEKERVRLHIEVFGYVLMPDHVHFVVGPSVFPPGTIVQWMKLSSAYSLRHNGLLRQSPWARSYWDRGIENAIELRRAIQYLHDNPLKAGLAEAIDAYRFSSYVDYYGLGNSILRITQATF